MFIDIVKYTAYWTQLFTVVFNSGFMFVHYQSVVVIIVLVLVIGGASLSTVLFLLLILVLVTTRSPRAASIFIHVFARINPGRVDVDSLVKIRDRTLP